jgi:hypothetical protein
MVVLSGANQSALPGEQIEMECKPESSPFLKERYRYMCLLGVRAIMDGNKGYLSAYSHQYTKDRLQYFLDK